MLYANTADMALEIANEMDLPYSEAELLVDEILSEEVADALEAILESAGNQADDADAIDHGS